MSPPPGPRASTRKERRRRSPEEAQQELLDAAERLLTSRGPEHVGLKAVASEIGVSHGLVVHYFGSYAGLVRAVLARRTQTVAAETVKHLQQAQQTLDFELLCHHVFAFVADPLRARWAMWLSLQDEGARAERPPGAGLLPQLVSLLEQMLPEMRKRQGKPPVTREHIELAAMAMFTAGQGYALSGARLQRVLGRDEGSQAFSRALWRMIEAYLDAPERPDPSTAARAQPHEP